MNEIFSYISTHAQESHYLFFGLLLLAGINFPISEDLLLLTAGAVANLSLPEDALYLYIWVFFGCWISGSEAYWLGRVFGVRLYSIPLFRKILSPEKIEQLKVKYEKLGIWIFIAGRFIPCGFRNALFITSGMGKMPYKVFLMRDGIACLFSSASLFSVGFHGAAHHDALFAIFKRFHLLLLMLIGLTIIYYIFLKVINKRVSNEPAA